MLNSQKSIDILLEKLKNKKPELTKEEIKKYTTSNQEIIDKLIREKVEIENETDK